MSAFSNKRKKQTDIKIHTKLNRNKKKGGDMETKRENWGRKKW